MSAGRFDDEYLAFIIRTEPDHTTVHRLCADLADARAQLAALEATLAAMRAALEEFLIGPRWN
jgi:UDP-N-acetylmuramyl tripeptide synthase